MSDDRYTALRHEMVTVIAAYVQHTGDRLGKETLDGRVMEAMGKVPRHAFVTRDLAPFAYYDSPLPIGFDKTISQPFMVALMTDLLDVQQGDRVLEVGTGLGYHTAILAELAAAVFSVEIIEELAERAGGTLRHLGYDTVEMRVGDGSKGWHEHAPFDKILVAAGARPGAAVPHHATQTGRQDGGPGGPSRRSAIDGGGKGRGRPPDHAGHPAGQFRTPRDRRLGAQQLDPITGSESRVSPTWESMIRARCKDL